MESKPAKVDVFESHNGAETMPGSTQFCLVVRDRSQSGCGCFTILYQDGKTALHQQGGVEDDQAEAQWHHIVAGPHFEEISDSLLHMWPPFQSARLSQVWEFASDERW